MHETPQEPDAQERGQPEWSEPQEETETRTDDGPESKAERRSGLDPDVASVLREEAERERQVRASGGLETQPDLGLSAGEDSTRARETRERMARLRGTAPSREEAERNAGAEMMAPSRRNFLPEIDDIDPALQTGRESTTEDASARDGSATAVTEPGGAGGFRRGMRLAILLAILATAIYVYAPRIIAAAPSLSAPLTAYVEAVNAARIMLDEKVGALVETIKALTAR